VEFELPLGRSGAAGLSDLLTGENCTASGALMLTLPPYGAAVLVEDEN
jgi:hypothetical protein